MRGRAFRLSIFSCFSTLVMFFWIASAYAQGPTIVCQPVSGAAPTIDGSIGAGEWPATPNLTLGAPNYPIETNFTCVYDAQNLYILVEAVGDTTESVGDECLLVFDLPPMHKIVEIWSTATDIIHRFDGGSSGQSQMGFDGHRVYEFMINLGSIGLQRGGSIPFYSPAQYKDPGVWASMPYDAGSYKDNIFPYNLQVTEGPVVDDHVTIGSVTNYATLVLYNTSPAPALSPVVMFCVALLLVVMAVRLLHRKRHGCA
jgi:hypothetical protein